VQQPIPSAREIRASRAPARVHSHLREARGTYKIGPTVCINPGSEYNEGILRGALIGIKNRKLKSHQFTTG
jgi:uncharacterized protein